MVDVVNFNVGGTRFTTFKTTLLKHPNSLFELLLDDERASKSNIPVTRDINNDIVLDRDPILFRLILNYLRNDLTFGFIRADQVDVKALEQELNYYMLHEALFDFKLITSQYLRYNASLDNDHHDLLWKIKSSPPTHHQILYNQYDVIKTSLLESNFSNSIEFNLLYHEILVKDITFDLSLEGDFKREDPTIVVEAMPPTVTNEWKQITSLATNYRYQNVKGIFNIDPSVLRGFYHRLRITVKYKVNKVNVNNIKLFGFIRGKL